jgi:hypothetical protein
MLGLLVLAYQFKILVWLKAVEIKVELRFLYKLASPHGLNQKFEPVEVLAKRIQSLIQPVAVPNQVGEE